MKPAFKATAATILVILSITLLVYLIPKMDPWISLDFIMNVFCGLFLFLIFMLFYSDFKEENQ